MRMLNSSRFTVDEPSGKKMKIRFFKKSPNRLIHSKRDLSNVTDLVQILIELRSTLGEDVEWKKRKYAKLIRLMKQRKLSKPSRHPFPEFVLLNVGRM